jgi:tetratricopeptide (TPR) repeat protein
VTHVPALLRRGVALAAAGRLEDALRLATEAVEAAPNSATAQECLGSVLVLLGRPVEAANSLSRAIELDPTLHSAINNFGALLRSIGKRDQALRYFEHALDLAPAFHDALVNATECFLECERFDDAVFRIYRAMDAGDRTAASYDMLGTVHMRAQRTRAALQEFETAVCLDPEFADAWAHLSEARTITGDLDGARDAIAEAVRLAPDRAEFYRFLTATTRSAQDEDPELALVRMVSNGKLAPQQRLEAHFALGDIAATRQEWSRAFEHYVNGNRIQRSLLPYEEAATLAQFIEIPRVFDSNAIAKGALGYHESDQPVFIFGMPRSGTTLVEQIIASHPYAYAGGELTYFDDLTIDEFGTPGPVTAAVAQRYDAAIRSIAPPMALRVTDKMPSNFRYAGLIHMVFPHARMIHVSRDPLDTCWSCFSTRFSEGLPWTCDIGELGRFYRGYASLMEHWRTVLPPNAMLEVRYEDLITNFETQARRIIAYCGLTWDDRCLTFYETDRPVRTASAAQVRKPIYESSIGRARHYGELLRPLADALGVEL